NPVPSPVELVENDQSGLSVPSAPGPRPLGSGCVRVFATSWPYIGHCPPPVGGVEHGALAIAIAVDVRQIPASASARDKQRGKVTPSVCRRAGLLSPGCPPRRRARRPGSTTASLGSRV